MLDVLRGPIGGAGGKSPRPALIIVANDLLMDRHQSELAGELGRLRVCFSCSIEYSQVALAHVNKVKIRGLSECIQEYLSADNSALSSLPSPNTNGLNSLLLEALDA